MQREQLFKQRLEEWNNKRLRTTEEIMQMISKIPPYSGPFNRSCPYCGDPMSYAACTIPTPEKFCCVICAHDLVKVIPGKWPEKRRIIPRYWLPKRFIDFMDIDSDSFYKVSVKSLPRNSVILQIIIEIYRLNGLSFSEPEQAHVASIKGSFLPAFAQHFDFFIGGVDFVSIE